MPEKKDDPSKMIPGALEGNIRDDYLTTYICEKCRKRIKFSEMRMVEGPDGRILHYHKRCYKR
jgi:hypothetical protein